LPTNLLDSQDVKVEKTIPLVNIMELERLSTQLNSRAQIATECITYPQANPNIEEVRVAMAEMKVENKPIELVTSVGSCVAICLYDSTNKCGGLAHIMLPNSAMAPQDFLPCKFADTAIPALSSAVREISGKETPLSAKIAGGANVFKFDETGPTIGTKNVEAVKTSLNENRIRLVAEDVGGSYGRRIAFNLRNGSVVIRMASGEIKKL
jgi:chemotaxis protein CheD